MARRSPSPSWFLLLISLLAVLSSHAGASEPERKVYIVYMGNIPKGDVSVASLHVSMLEQVVGSGASESLLYSYKRSFNGFAAKLSEEEMKKMEGMDGIASIFPSKVNTLHTTRSWDFMGFPQNANRTIVESDVIVGVLDTGIWPESDSFNDKGLGPPPTKWKGTCQSSSNFTCNNKIIGARFYHSGEIGVGDIDSPRDSEGHGSHTASTAAGSQVSDASLMGLAEGMARGGVPSARIAVYKICWSGGCSDADILAAFDDAISDGVDIISLSVGSFVPLDYFEDSIAIGAFHAMKNGILTSNSAGNSGPSPSSVANFSPWSLTVAASSIDRKFVSTVVLGNNKTYQGPTINAFDLNDTMYPFVYGGNVPNTSAGYVGSESRYCIENSLDSALVTGKIVFCDELSDTSGPLLATAVGTVMQDSRYTDLAFSFPMAAAYILEAFGGAEVLDYINSTSNATASILKSTELKDPTAPIVVSFSSRGPNPITSDILKPDLTAPGVDILAAWSPIASMSVYDDDKRSVSYNIISGTSMSCPHATGAAAYVKSFHPTWSPAAIKSALMTTAYPLNATAHIDREFAYGAGHINPIGAINPGLVYDAGEIDYINMLCGQGYQTKQLRLVTGDNSSCSSTTNGTVWDLNYPSFALTFGGNSFSGSFNRTVTNVGSASSTYQASVIAPAELKISVEPSILSFKLVGEKQSFVVTVAGKTIQKILSASLVWSDGVHQVKSPIVVSQSFQNS